MEERVRGGLELLDAAQQRVGSWGEAKGEVLVEGAEVELAWHGRFGGERLQLGGEAHGSAIAVEVQRLHPELVAREHQRLAPRIPEREPEDAVEPGDEV